MNKGIVVGANRGANNGANGIEKGIVAELKSAGSKPLSTSDLSFKLNKAWHTIDRACLMLQIIGKVDGFKIGKMNLWRLK